MLSYDKSEEIISLYGEEIEVVECAEGICMQCECVCKVVRLNSGHVLCEDCLLEGLREGSFDWSYLDGSVFEEFRKK